MSPPPLLELLHNASLLLAMALVFSILSRNAGLRQRKAVPQVMLGLVVGAIAMGIMLTPWQFAPGIVFDARSVLLGISGVFFGAIPTAVAMAMASALRIAQGGAAAAIGVSVIVASGVLGIAWRRSRRGVVEDLTFPPLLAFGVVVHVTMLALMLLLPWETARQVLSAIAFPVLLIFPLSTALLGTLMANDLRRQQFADRLAASEERFRALTELSVDWYWEQDENLRFTRMSKPDTGSRTSNWTPSSGIRGAGRRALSGTSRSWHDSRRSSPRGSRSATSRWAAHTATSRSNT